MNLLGILTVDSSPGAKGRITSETSCLTGPHRSLALMEVKRIYIEGEVLDFHQLNPQPSLRDQINLELTT